MSAFFVLNPRPTILEPEVDQPNSLLQNLSFDLESRRST
jgi:hypothetical protein